MVRSSSRRGMALFLTVALVGSLALPAAAMPLDGLGQGRGVLAVLWQWWAGWFGVEKYGPMVDPTGIISTAPSPVEHVDAGPMADPNGQR